MSRNVAADIFDTTTRALVDEPVPQSVLEQHAGFDYAPVEHVIKTMNACFGSNWDMEITQQPRIAFETEGKDRDGRLRMERVWSATVKVTVRGHNEAGQPWTITREATGTALSYGDGVELLRFRLKAAESDAFKRAVRTLGNALGMSLYLGGDLEGQEPEAKGQRPVRRVAAPPPPTRRE